ncbi:MAG: UDP-glucose 4-epimerase GalE [Planctomycetota bacterium]
MNVLVTGGAGYIGSHAALRLLRDGHRVTIIDDLSRGHIEAIRTLESHGDLAFHHGSVGERTAVEEILRSRSIDVVMHFAAKAYVGESVEQPLVYYRRNTADALGLLEAMDAVGVPRLVFSSTCATYGEPDANQIPIRETCPQHPINPYGRSKLMVEHMLFDYAHMKAMRGDDFAFAALRYFNVAGSDREGLVGEDHRPETHLVPICLEAALGVRDDVKVFGTDYDTPDGTCIRDYVHVEDLIDAHVTVLDALRANESRVYNVGIGRGYSVREVIEACQRVTGVEFEVGEAERRPGDPPALFADPTSIRDELHWTASFTNLDDIIRTAWTWRTKHPHGYAETASSAAD